MKEEEEGEEDQHEESIVEQVSDKRNLRPPRWDQSAAARGRNPDLVSSSPTRQKKTKHTVVGWPRSHSRSLSKMSTSAKAQHVSEAIYNNDMRLP